MKDCLEAWAEAGGSSGMKVAYLHWLYRCSGFQQDRRRWCAYFLKGYAVRSRYLHGDGRFPMTDGRRPELSRIIFGRKAIEAARQEAEEWIRSERAGSAQGSMWE